MERDVHSLTPFFSPDNFLQFLSIFCLPLPIWDRPEHAGITALQLNSFRPMHLSAQCNGTCSVVMVGGGRQAALLWSHAFLTSKSLHTQGISPALQERKYLGVSLFTNFSRDFFCSFFPWAIDSNWWAFIQKLTVLSAKWKSYRCNGLVFNCSSGL